MGLIAMRLGYNILILILLLICIWFFHECSKDKSYYRNAFNWYMIFVGLMYVNRIYGIAIIENRVSYYYPAHVVERTVHYLLSFGIYVLYAFFLICLLDQFQYYKVWIRLLFEMPAYIISLLIITSPWTKLIFYIEDGECYQGSLFWLMMASSVVYALGATIHALIKGKLLPGIFRKSIILSFITGVFQLHMYCVSEDDILYNSTRVITVLIFVLALTVVEFYKDSQTGMLNREAFEQYVKKEIGRKRDQAVYLIKLKNYSYLKENCHEKPLQEMIKELAECIKEYSLLSSIYHLGEGKFCIIVPKHSAFSEETFLHQIKERFCIPFDVNGASVQLSLFVAIMNLKSGKITKDNFLKYFCACDEMKYRSNDLIEIVQGDTFGIDQVQRYHNIEEAIERALVEHEFKIFYQPIVSTKTKKVVSAEALIRLNDRVLGFVSPEEFIPISESNGKIHEISEYVIDSVFKFVKTHDLEKMGIKFIEMNLSMIQCMDKKLPSKLKQYLDTYDIEPKYINLEITETATHYDEERLKEQLSKIKELGFSFSLDDYGTGYSNLVRVLEYPVDMIKLDKSIVWSAFHVKDNFTTLKNLVSMFHDVRRKIVAEGVESEEQMEALTELGCDYLQGYYYSKPICEEDFVNYVHKHN